MDQLIVTPISQVGLVIRKTCPFHVYPLESHFYIAKTGVCRDIPILPQNIDFGYSLDTIYVLSKNKKNVKKKITENFQFYNKRRICILQGCVFVMGFIA